MAIIQDWKIRNRAHRCFDTDRAFEDGERVCTGIFADPDSDGYLRRDYCLEAWERLRDDLQPFSCWQATYHPPEEEPEPHALGHESAEAMLRRMIDEDDPATENARYILVLMLERKKTLIPVDAQELESRRMLFYEHKENGDVFVIADPQLHLNEVEKIQQEVLLLLQGKRADTAGEEAAEGGTAETETKTDPGADAEAAADVEAEGSLNDS